MATGMTKEEQVAIEKFLKDFGEGMRRMGEGMAKAFEPLAEVFKENQDTIEMLKTKMKEKDNDVSN